MDDETRLALAAGQGDRAAAGAFVRATQRRVWRFVANLAGPGEADDLTQETYVRALRSLPGFAARSSALTWLLVIARRVVVDHRRGAAAQPRIAALDTWPAGADSRAARAYPVEDGVVLRRLLDGLAPERRDALVATQVLGLSYAEAAEVCDCPVGTIRSRVARARDDMIAAMADTGCDAPAEQNFFARPALAGVPRRRTAERPDGLAGRPAGLAGRPAGLAGRPVGRPAAGSR